MSGIVCSIRGGVESLVTVFQGVTLARETGLPLSFLHVVNTDLLSAADGQNGEVVSEHLQGMGFSVVGAAKAWAQTQGVESQGFVRMGEVEAEVSGLCQDLDATYLVLGRSSSGNDGIYDPNQFAKFIERLGARTETVVVFR